MGNSTSLQTILKSLQKQKFTGRVDITDRSGQKWQVYLWLSRLVWINGGINPEREWQRQLNKYCPELDRKLLNLPQAQKYECWNYYLIISLLQRFLITKKQAYILIKNQIKQNLLDIYQAQEIDGLDCEVVTMSSSTSFPEQTGLKTSITLINIEKILADIEMIWSKWKELDLVPWNPHFTPVIKNQILLKQQFPGEEDSYNKLIVLLDGQFSLIELADKLNINIFTIMVWFKPYFESGILDLLPLSQKDKIENLVRKQGSQKRSLRVGNSQLIACIDDSVQICEIMEHILTEAGYKFMSIQEPLKAIPQLLKRKPALILLDLVMPIVNGYEICTQIRRISALKDTPIIILTGNDGVIDRLRSKMVGANGFLGKPIDQQKLLEKIRLSLSDASFSE